MKSIGLKRKRAMDTIKKRYADGDEYYKNVKVVAIKNNKVITCLTPDGNHHIAHVPFLSLYAYYPPEGGLYWIQAKKKKRRKGIIK